MAFLLNKLVQPRLTYVPGSVSEFELPSGNLISGINMLLQGEVNIASANASNAPSFQVWNLIARLEIIRDTTNVINLDGRMLAAIFTNRNGVDADSNLAVVGTVANDVKFQSYLPLVFAADNALKPWDLLLDTRAHRYFVRILWKNVSDTGVLFGTNAANVSVTALSDIYIDYEIERLDLRLTQKGEDQLANASPKMRGLYQQEYKVEQSGQVVMDFPPNKIVRGIHLFPVETANSVEVGRNTVLSGDIIVEDTNNRTYHRRKAEFVRQETSQVQGTGTNVVDGYYYYDFIRFGSLYDALKDEPIAELRLRMDVTKLSGATKVLAVFDTIEMQGKAS